MLRLPPFELRSPRTVADAATMLADGGPGTRLVAGGTDLWPNMKRRHQQAETVIRLTSIPELSGISNGSVSNGDGAGELRLGATTSLDDVAANAAVSERYPALTRAVASISSPPLRNMGTIGGNLCLDTRCTYYNQTEDWRRSIDYCMKEAGTVCWVAPSSPRCWAHSASDSAPILCALGARARLVSAEGERVVAVADLFRDDGIDYLAKRPDEILTEILLPAESSADRVRSSFWKLRRRGSIDFAVLSVAVALRCDDGGRVEDARIWLGAVGSSPAEAVDAMQALHGEELNEDSIAAAARVARKVARPMDNTDFQAQWRGKMVEVYTSAALREAAGMDPGIAAPKH